MENDIAKTVALGCFGFLLLVTAGCIFGPILELLNKAVNDSKKQQDIPLSKDTKKENQ